MKKFDRSLIPAYPDLIFEKSLWKMGFGFVGGVDEAGRGALAGPVSAAVVILPPDPQVALELAGLRDSKLMNVNERERWRERLQILALECSVGFSSHLEIDEIGIVPATKQAIRRAVENLAVSPQHLLVDFLELPELPIPQTPLVKGDARSLSIAAAAVLAKTARDDLMRLLDLEYPAYGFAAHKGYGTQAHLRALNEHGPCPIHRMSFRYKQPVEV
jgi:ribonuclease HII